MTAFHSTLDVPVLVVGGGGSGLVASSLLSRLGVPSLLVERHPTTSQLPKAHYLNQRTMEILRNFDLDGSIDEIAAPPPNFSEVHGRTTLGGDGPLDGRIYAVMECWSGGTRRELYERNGSRLPANLPQIRLEPILRRLAEEQAPGMVRFNHELIELETAPDGVVAIVRDRATDERHEVRARYVIGADAGKTLGPRLGVKYEGPTAMAEMVSTHFSADLSPWVPDEAIITWFVNPQGGGSWASGALVKMGPTWDRRSEEWNFHFMFRPDDPARNDEAAIVPRIRDLLGLPDLEIEAHAISHWIVDRVVADRYRVGGVLLVGDAAHRQPPTTALGLNTGIQDVHNLCWKLAAVLRGDAPDALLDTYESERRPIGIFNADWGIFAFHNHFVSDAGLGLRPGLTPEEQRETLTRHFSDTPIGRLSRARFEIAYDTARLDFQAHDVEIGFHYEEGALAGDGTTAPDRDPLGSVHVPTSRPGHRLPHAWLASTHGTLSTHDLVLPGHFTVLTGADGAAWIDAAAAIAGESGIRLDAHLVGGPALQAADEQWAAVCGIETDGVLLVRPDQHVGWRAATMLADPQAGLREALGSILRRQLPVPVETAVGPR